MGELFGLMGWDGQDGMSRALNEQTSQLIDAKMNQRVGI